MQARGIGIMLKKYWKTIFSKFLKVARQAISKTNVRHNSTVAKMIT